MNRRHRERFALIALAMWHPADRPEPVDDEAISVRAAALRKWRGQPDDEDADVKAADALSGTSRP